MTDYVGREVLSVSGAAPQGLLDRLVCGAGEHPRNWGSAQVHL